MLDGSVSAPGGAAVVGCAGTVPLREGPMALDEALRVLGTELARDLPADVREDVADALHKLATRQGSARDQQQVAVLLNNSQSGKRAA